MSLTMSRIVWENSQSIGSQKLIMLCLADHADDNGRCWPSISRISRLTRVSKRQVSRSLKSLVGKGELAYKPGDGRGHSSEYVILLKGDMVSTNGGIVKDDICDTKDDICDTKDDICDTKDDTMSDKPLRTIKEPSKNRKGKSRKQKKPITFEIPGILNTIDFMAAWGEYVQHRKEIKKPLTPTAGKRQLKQLESWGLQRAIVAINHSIAKGWLSIYEPKNYQQTNGRQPTANSSTHHALHGQEVKQVQGEF